MAPVLVSKGTNRSLDTGNEPYLTIAKRNRGRPQLQDGELNHGLEFAFCRHLTLKTMGLGLPCEQTAEVSFLHGTQDLRNYN